MWESFRGLLSLCSICGVFFDPPSTLRRAIIGARLFGARRCQSLWALVILGARFRGYRPRLGLGLRSRRGLLGPERRGRGGGGWPGRVPREAGRAGSTDGRGGTGGPTSVLLPRPVATQGAGPVDGGRAAGEEGAAGIS